MTALRVGVASIVQETNTFSPVLSTFANFEQQGIFRGADVAQAFAGTNTEVAGALAEITSTGAEAVPIARAWAMSSGPVTKEALRELSRLLTEELVRAGHLDGLALSLHGALVTEEGDSGDLVLLRTAREVLGPQAVVGVCLDLHANVTTPLVREADAIIGYLTYPHVDQGSTGARIARLVVGALRGELRPVTRLAKRPLLIAAEAQGFDGPLGEIRRRADEELENGCLDVSLFPVQPWLDVDELGFGVTVTTDSDADQAETVAEEIASRTWEIRGEFRVPLVEPQEALERARRTMRRPVVLSESADSPTSGTPADSPAMVRELLAHGGDLRSAVTLVDARAVAACQEAGTGGTFAGEVGCSLETRFHKPVHLSGVVNRLGGGSFELTGPAFTGMTVNMGDYAVVTTGNTQVLLTTRPAPTFDPQAYRVAGIEVGDLDVVVVRSANLFRAAYAPIAAECIILDLPGASTPRLETLPFKRAPRPMYPLDQ
jgi:microcystin degradation protein MlrC